MAAEKTLGTKLGWDYIVSQNLKGKLSVEKSKYINFASMETEISIAKNCVRLPLVLFSLLGNFSSKDGIVDENVTLKICVAI